mmetsp:Transcript_76354/g.233654  ORF Transcript_76354/g.233654 Transcript_76354/m.233654 type:complete len:202 (-) Transcript_76354:163-768(-)
MLVRAMIAGAQGKRPATIASSVQNRLRILFGGNSLMKRMAACTPGILERMATKATPPKAMPSKIMPNWMSPDAITKAEMATKETRGAYTRKAEREQSLLWMILKKNGSRLDKRNTWPCLSCTTMVLLVTFCKTTSSLSHTLSQPSTRSNMCESFWFLNWIFTFGSWWCMQHGSSGATTLRHPVMATTPPGVTWTRSPAGLT